MEFNKPNLDKLEMRCRYFLNEVKANDKDLWSNLIVSYEKADLEDLPQWFEQAQKEYKQKLGN